MTRSRSLFLAGLTIVLLAPGCSPDEEALRRGQAGGDSPDPVTLTVFAAASLAEAFTTMAQAFEDAQPGAEVLLNLAGSQQLAQQLALGAPADVFASANQQQMRAVVEAGRIDAEAVQPFAGNRLVVVLPEANPAGLERLQDLARPGLRLVLAAEEVPVGRYTRRFLERASLNAAFGPAYGPDVLAQVASFEQNVRAVLTKVALGEADAGIVYTSDLVGAGAEHIGRIDLPGAFNSVAVYPIALVSDSAHPDLARAFIAFVCSPEGQEILVRYGFGPS